MDIHELIEQIAASGKKYGIFYITMLNTKSPMYTTALNCRGEEVASSNYYGLSTENKYMRKAEDVIAFLFDADIHLWQLVSCDIQRDRCCGYIYTWNITLRR